MSQNEPTGNYFFDRHWNLCVIRFSSQIYSVVWYVDNFFSLSYFSGFNLIIDMLTPIKNGFQYNGSFNKQFKILVGSRCYIFL